MNHTEYCDIFDLKFKNAKSTELHLCNNFTESLNNIKTTTTKQNTQRSKI